MHTYHAYLKRIPFEVLDTYAGCAAVKAELIRLDHGIVYRSIVESFSHYQTPLTFLEDHFPVLPSGWKDNPEICMKFGKQWIEGLFSPILRVPSVHSPWEYNFLINPQHPELDIAMVDQTYYVYDDRFLYKGER